MVLHIKPLHPITQLQTNKRNSLCRPSSNHYINYRESVGGYYRTSGQLKVFELHWVLQEIPLTVYVRERSEHKIGCKDIYRQSTSYRFFQAIPALYKREKICYRKQSTNEELLCIRKIMGVCYYDPTSRKTPL